MGGDGEERGGGGEKGKKGKHALVRHKNSTPPSLPLFQAEVRACVHKKKGGALTADVRELSFVLDV